MRTNKTYRGWEYWSNPEDGQYIAVRYIGQQQASEPVTAETHPGILQAIDNVEDRDEEAAGDLPLEEVVCPACYGIGQEIGQLGSTAHYRCRHCGVIFSA
jgi:hypothetical protein